MPNLIITAGSVTTAVRLEKRLNAAGIINTAVIHTPPAISSGGCSYSVRVSYKYLSWVLNILSERKLKFKKLFKEDSANGESVYNALS